MRKKILQKDNFNQAVAYAFLLLKYRVRSTSETVARLRKKRYAPETIEKVIAYLQEYKYLDDNNFAHTFTEYALAKNWGPRKIDFELKKFGIPAALRQKALSNVNYRGKLKDLIMQKIDYYRSRNRNASHVQIRQKMMRSLMARGFSYQEIVTAIEDEGVCSEDS